MLKCVRFLGYLATTTCISCSGVSDPDMGQVQSAKPSEGFDTNDSGSQNSGEILTEENGELSVLEPLLNANGCDLRSWWNDSFGLRSNLKVSAPAAGMINEQYSVKLTVDHAALVAENKSLPEGQDFRLVYYDSECQWVEIDRIVDPQSSFNSNNTELWFATYNAIEASSVDENYFIYYDHNLAANPLENAQNVFIDFENFDQIPAANKFMMQQNGAGISYAGGDLVIAATTDDSNRTMEFGLIRTEPYPAGTRIDSAVSLTLPGSNTWKMASGLNLSTLGFKSALASYYDSGVNAFVDVSNAAVVDVNGFDLARISHIVSPNKVSLIIDDEIEAEREIETMNYQARWAYSPDTAAGASFELRVHHYIARSFLEYEADINLTVERAIDTAGLLALP